MRVLTWCVVLALLQITCCKKRQHKGTQWWSLAKTGEPSNDLYSPTAQAHLYSSPTLLPLTKKQRRLVTKNPGTIVAIAKGARMAVEECQHQFKDRRWNCPVQENGHGGSIFGKIIEKGCRETAFIYAITSAAVAHAVARSCADGSIYTCTCNYNLRQPDGVDWEWGGCSDNANFGKKFSRKFVDVVEKGRDFRYMMNLHNNEAGRRKRFLEVDTFNSDQTQSYSASGKYRILPYYADTGGQNTQVLWEKTISNETVGRFGYELFSQYESVLTPSICIVCMSSDRCSGIANVTVCRVVVQLRPAGCAYLFSERSETFSKTASMERQGCYLATMAVMTPKTNDCNGNNGRRGKNKFRLEPANPNHKRPDKRDLVYFEDSPNFCDKVDSIAFPGTTGRVCNATSIGIDGCDLMCCGRGYKSETYTVKERCSCTFHWCCEVKCKVCTRTKVKNTCL